MTAVQLQFYDVIWGPMIRLWAGMIGPQAPGVAPWIHAFVGAAIPEELLKAHLTLQIYKIVKARNLTQAAAAELLGIPYEKVTQGGLFPIAYTQGTDFKPANRLPLSQVMHWNSW